jgi:XRE family aerobic/anaerobic benzoate catabolism transcriptional regulator
MAELRNILTSREALYARAEVHVDTSQAALKESLGVVLGAIAKHGFLTGG